MPGTDLLIALKVDGENPDVGDIRLINGTATLTRTLAEDVAQFLYVSLNLWKGEWFLDPDQGIPYWQSILGIKAPLSVVGGIFRRAILKAPGVKEITDFNLVRLSARQVSLQFACSLNDGTVIKSEDFTPFIIGV